MVDVKRVSQEIKLLRFMNHENVRFLCARSLFKSTVLLLQLLRLMTITFGLTYVCSEIHLEYHVKPNLSQPVHGTPSEIVLHVLVTSAHVSRTSYLIAVTAWDMSWCQRTHSTPSRQKSRRAGSMTIYFGDVHI